MVYLFHIGESHNDSSRGLAPLGTIVTFAGPRSDVDSHWTFDPSRNMSNPRCKNRPFINGSLRVIFSSLDHVERMVIDSLPEAFSTMSEVRQNNHLLWFAEGDVMNYLRIEPDEQELTCLVFRIASNRTSLTPLIGLESMICGTARVHICVCTLNFFILLW